MEAAGDDYHEMASAVDHRVDAKNSTSAVGCDVGAVVASSMVEGTMVAS